MKDSIEYSLVYKILSIVIGLGKEKHIKGILSKLERKKRITRWELYNAITNYATHGEQIKPNLEMWLQEKSNKVLKNPLKILAEVEKK
jgi:hypothetical protein